MSSHENKPFAQSPLSDWMRGVGPESDIVISSRVRVARNLKTQPFPIVASGDQAHEALNQLLVVPESGRLNGMNHFDTYPMAELNELERRVLVEKHLISPNLANESKGGAVIVSRDESVSIMVNEEDHLRIQCLSPGLQLHEAWKLASTIDDIFEEVVEFAYDERRGYLTSCPTNVGTGIRASVMVHLPGLVLTQQANRILQAVTQVGLAVRGLYGEGSEAQGNLFQISNQVTLGQSENEIIDNLHNVVKQIIEHERVARMKLLHEAKPRIVDRICRSFGILSYAATIESKESTQRLSDVRLGIDLGLVVHRDDHGDETLPTSGRRVMNELMVMTQPGYLQQARSTVMTADERDVVRAEVIRGCLQDIFKIRPINGGALL